MRKSKLLMFFVIFSLAIGFATISATLYLNGTISVIPDEASFINNVIFEDDSITISEDSSFSISETGKTITLSMPAFKSIGEKREIKFKVKNDSIYDAKLGNPAISCYFVDSFVEDEVSEKKSDENDYITISPLNNLDNQIILKNSLSDESKITIEQKRSYAGETSMRVKFQCVINVDTYIGE